MTSLLFLRRRFIYQRRRCRRVPLGSPTSSRETFRPRADESDERRPGPRRRPRRPALIFDRTMPGDRPPCGSEANHNR
jgi:hypothetical protein